MAYKDSAPIGGLSHTRELLERKRRRDGASGPKKFLVKSVGGGIYELALHDFEEGDQEAGEAYKRVESHIPISQLPHCIMENPEASAKEYLFIPSTGKDGNSVTGQWDAFAKQ